MFNGVCPKCSNGEHNLKTDFGQKGYVTPVDSHGKYYNGY